MVAWTSGGIQIIFSSDNIIAEYVIAEYVIEYRVVIIIETLGLIWFLYCNLPIRTSTRSKCVIHYVCLNRVTHAQCRV